MLRKLLSYVRENDLLRPGDRLAVAVSGGADSVALLRALLELRCDLGLVLSVVHVHHGIRGAEADADLDFITGLARRYDLELHLHRVDVPEFARERSLSLEAAGREVRYQYFADLVANGCTDKVATAHTYDDQAETVLLRIIRGAGLQGIAGIHPALLDPRGEKKTVIRPMLGIRRTEVVEFLRSVGQDWREDTTNADVGFSRNRVRHELLPVLERDYNPAIRDSLNSLAEIALADSDYLVKQAADLAEDVCDWTTLELSPVLLLRLPVSLQRQVLLHAAAEMTGIRLNFAEVEDLRTMAAGEKTSVQLAGGHLVQRLRRGDQYVLKFAGASESRNGRPQRDYEYVLNVPGEVYVPESGDRIRATKVQLDHTKPVYNFAASLDASRTKGSLTLRNWRPGDRFRPLHTKAAEKLKRLFQEKKIPQAERATWPVLLSGNEIVWVRGFPVSAEYAARPGSPAAVLIEVLPGNGAK